MAVPFLIDSDMALDDWMAILYLLKHPRVAVKAIAVVATGEAHAWPGVRHAFRLLALAEHPIIPVAAGPRHPLQGRHVFPFRVRFIVDRFLYLKVKDLTPAAAGQGGVALIVETLEAAREPIHVVALGPLTNLAAVFQQRPDLAGKVAGITIMGGALDVPGNIEALNPRIDNPYAEWNIFIDPFAANVVFRSGAPVTLVPLDATNQVPLTREFLRKMEDMQGGPALDFVRRALQRIGRFAGSERPYYFWDPLAAVVALHPEIANFEMRKVRVVEDEGPESGRVLGDPDGPEVRICMSVDQPEFEHLYLEQLK
jgi:inosine-uridine nucleoside N-ribohydrolase